MNAGMHDQIRLAQTVDRFVRRIHVELQHRAPQVDTDRVGPWGGMILFTIAEAQPVSIQAVTQRTGRDKSQMTRKLKELEAKRLVVRAGSEQDRRVTLLSLTAKGERLVDALQSVLGGVIEEILQPLSRDEQGALLEMLERL